MDAEAQSECLRVCYLSPKNLCKIRDRNFESFWLWNHETSFDDLLYFCEKFEIDYDQMRNCCESNGWAVKSLFLNAVKFYEDSEPSEVLSLNRQSSMRQET